MNPGERKVGVLLLISAAAIFLFVAVLAVGRHLATPPEEGTPERAEWDARVVERIRQGEGTPPISVDAFDRGVEGMHYELGRAIVAVEGQFLAFVEAEGEGESRVILRGSGKRRVEGFPLESEWERLRTLEPHSTVTMRGVVDRRGESACLLFAVLED